MGLSGRKIRWSKSGVDVVGARSDNLTIGAEPVDITDKDDNGWRTLLNDAGLLTVSGEVAGVLKDGTLTAAAMSAGNLLLDDCICTIDGIGTISGDFWFQSFALTGEQADAITFTATLEGSGTFVVTIAPYVTVLPVISGTPTVGQTLTRTTGTWGGDATITFATQWQEGPTNNPNDPRWVNISGATGATRVLAAGQAGKYVRARVTATNGVGSTVAFSNILGPVAP